MARGPRFVLASIALAGAVAGGALLVRAHSSPTPPAGPGVGGAPAGSAAAAQLGDPRLAWAPPALDSPETIDVTTGEIDLQLDPHKDYILRLPATPLESGAGLAVNGGRNVVLIGGTINIPKGSKGRRIGLRLNAWTGTMHVEGLHITGDLLEGIDANSGAPGTVLQLEAVRVERVHGAADKNHADVLQVWQAATQVRVDRLTGVTDYQGFFLNPNDPRYDHPGPVQQIDLRRVDLHLVDDGTTGYLYYAAGDRFPLRCAQCFADAPTKEFPAQVLYEKWQQYATGDPVIAGSPDGSFAPTDLVGVGYRSPGYR